jgi:YegS/Rv2252/BmrU family lipid kinase
MSFYFIVNPRSANGRSKKIWLENVEPILKEKGIDFSYAFTEYSTHATELARIAIKEKGFKKIISFGGDGTIHEVANGIVDSSGNLLDKDVKFGVLSSGTGSDFIKTIGIPPDPVKAIDIILKEKIQIIDLLQGTCTDIKTGEKTTSFSINMASFGLGGDVVYDINKSSKFLGGKLTFLLISLKQILKHKPYHCRFKLDDGEWVDSNINVFFIGNGQYNGGGMHSAAEAVVDDGIIDIFYVQGLKKGQLIKQINKLYGTAEEIRALVNSDPEAFHYLKCKKMSIESLEEKRSSMVEFDGEIVGKLPMDLKILPKRINLIIP